jgi:branched-chain amino acid transport system ATP-binding protein
MNAPAPLLKVANIETYYGPVMAIRGVSLEVERGSIVAILGANGAGKTTVLKTIAGLLDPAKGSIALEGRAIEGMRADRVARLGISLVMEGREVFPFLSVAENLAMGAYLRPDRENIEADRESIYALFPRLRERRAQPAGYLSGGEQQMLAIGRALMSKPVLMLLDEPSLGLSPLLTRQIYEVIARIRAERGVTILLVEQNARMALDHADHAYVLEVGRVVMADTAARLAERDDVKEFYLGVKDKGVRGARRWKRRKTWR